jgi:streptogramin lyase
LSFSSGLDTQNSTIIGSLGNGNGEFNYPSDISVDSNGKLYVADLSNHRIQVFKPDGTHDFNIGKNDNTSGTGDGEFYQPTGIAVDSNGKIYVADKSNNRIQVFNSDGTHDFNIGKNDNTSGTGDGEFNQPYGVAVDSNGKIYVTDKGNNRVQVFDTDGTHDFNIGKNDNTSGTGDGEFDGPFGIEVDNNGKIYVVEYNNNRVQVFNADGTYFSQFGSGGLDEEEFNNPRGISIGINGKIYVADATNSRIQIFNADGTYLSQFGSSGTGNGKFNQPGGVAVDGSGKIYVADNLNNNIQIFSNYKKVTGTPTTKGTYTAQFEVNDGTSTVPYNLKINVVDPKLEYVNTLKESTANDGSISGSVVVTLIGDKFASDVITANHITVSNVPNGLTASINKDSDTQLTITLTGNASGAGSLDNISNLTVSFADDAFVLVGQADVTDSNKADLNVSYYDGVINNLVANKWNMVSLPANYIVDSTKLEKEYLTDGKTIKALRNGDWVYNPTDIDQRDGLWVHPTGTDIPYAGTANLTTYYTDLNAQLTAYKQLEVKKWHFVAVQHQMSRSDLTKAKISPSSCGDNGYSVIKHYDANTDSWDTLDTIPANSAIWIKHFCEGGAL